MVKRNLPMITDPEASQEDQAAFNTRLQSQVDIMDARMTGMDVKLELLCKAVANLTHVVKGKSPAVATSSSEPIQNPELQNLDPVTENRAVVNHSDTNTAPRSLAGTLIKNISVEFPRFSGEDPRGWVKKCQRFFNVNPVLEEEKVMLAALHLDGKADNWYMDYFEGRNHVGWGMFTEMVIERFSEEDGVDIVEIFNNLKQKGSAEEYRLIFEDLKTQVMQLDLNWTEEYIIRCFIGGLKENLKWTVKMLRPQTLSQAIILAKHQENTANQFQQEIDSTVKHSAPPFRTQKVYAPDSKPHKTHLPDRPLRVQPSTTKTVPLKRLTPSEMEERKKRGLCFNCNERYTYGHKCKQLFFIEANEIEQDEEDTEELTEEVIEGNEEQDLGISVHALAGRVIYKTLKIFGKVKNNSISILIDTGSTHSFIDPQATQLFNSEVVYTNTLSVTVANGQKMMCDSKCLQFKWQMGGYEFVFDPKLLKLGGCDMVLGVDFLHKYGPAKFDYEARKVTLKPKFIRPKIKIKIQENQIDGEVEMISGNLSLR